MKIKAINILAIAMLAGIIVVNSGCHRDQTIVVSQNAITFLGEAATKTISIEANCGWSIEKDNTGDWFTVTPTSGENNGTISIEVPYYEGDEYRMSSFNIVSENGKTSVTVSVTQNGIDFVEIINTVWGVSQIEHWNTDYYNAIIEDSYKSWTYNPNDSTNGFLMCFLDDRLGYQIDHTGDTMVYYTFEYEYQPENSNLYIKFMLIDSTQVEEYNTTVLMLNDSIFKFMHEYKPHYFERAEMKKTGTVDPGAKALLRYAAKRKSGGPIFMVKE